MNKAIGILGGMGPEASAYLYKMLIDLSIKFFGACNNDDFPEIIFCSVPVPDFISDTNNKQKALIMLKERVQKLQENNIGSLSIACNTAHVLLPELQSVSRVPFVSMIYEVVEKVKKDGLKTVGLLATPSTIQFGLYQKALEGYGIETVIPTDKQIAHIEKVIRNILKGVYRNEDRQYLKTVSNSLIERGAEGIILGCTELPLVFPFSKDLKAYNSVEILALSLLEGYYAI